jgi:flavin-dependent thymidylate synthase
MKITLIQHTQNAEKLLIFSKRTRLMMNVEGFDFIDQLSDEDKKEELDYVFGTITSSLEFVDYVFLIEDVTRAFTHQLVRHRVGVAFAQQSQRTVDASGFNYYTPESCKNNHVYHAIMKQIDKAYQMMIYEDNIRPEDARGILPTNIHTNILKKINLIALSELISKRLCNRTQAEFRAAAENMKELVIDIHPWAEKILKCYCEEHGKCFFKNGKGCGKYAAD